MLVVASSDRGPLPFVASAQRSWNLFPALPAIELSMDMAAPRQDPEIAQASSATGQHDRRLLQHRRRQDAAEKPRLGAIGSAETPVSDPTL
jgi:hypothetical protein